MNLFIDDESSLNYKMFYNLLLESVNPFIAPLLPNVKSQKKPINKLHIIKNFQDLLPLIDVNISFMI